MIDVRAAQPGDTNLLTLRWDDLLEVSADWRARIETEIAQPDTTAVAIWDGDELLCLAGVTRGPAFVGPWMLASPSISKFPLETIKRARNFVRYLRDVEGTVGNYIGKQASNNRKFIEALGFVIIESPSGDHDFFYLPKHNV